MKALYKKEGKAPWHKTAIYRRRFKRFRAFQAAFMSVAAAQGQAKIMAMHIYQTAPAASAALMALASQEAIIRASKHAEKWRP